MCSLKLLYVRSKASSLDIGIQSSPESVERLVKVEIFRSHAYFACDPIEYVTTHKSRALFYTFLLKVVESWVRRWIVQLLSMGWPIHQCQDIWPIASMPLMLHTDATWRTRKTWLDRAVRPMFYGGSVMQCAWQSEMFTQNVYLSFLLFAVGHRDVTWVTVGVLWITRSFNLHDVSHHIQLRSERGLSSRHDAVHFLGLWG